MANDWITDHKWHDIKHQDLPDWVKRRIRELNRRSLIGKSFEYRREPTTGRYQRKLRRHPPRVVVWTKRAVAWVKRNLGKVFIILAALATIGITLSAVGLSIGGVISLPAAIAISLIGLGILLWSLRTLSKRRPRLTGIVMVLLISVIFIMFSSAYLDIRSLQDVGHSIYMAFSIQKGEFRSTVDMLVQRTELEIVDVSSTDEETEETQETIEKTKNTKHVYINGGMLVGADGHYITLKNNPNATDPSWEELKDFLLMDETDSQQYNYSTFVCADFAEMLHNNAEAAEIRAAYVTVQLGPCSYYLISGGHALNAFETTDKGLVYIDCTSPIDEDLNADKIVDVQVGEEYIPRSIFPEPGWSSVWGSMGVVEEIEVIEW